MTDCDLDDNAKIIYAIAIVQFLLGCLITVINTLMVAVLITTEKLRKDVTHLLLSNMWFANLLLGVIVAVVNVVETGGVYVVAIEKPKGTITIINSMVTIGTLFTLTTNRLLIIRANRRGMSLKHAAIVIVTIWSVVFVLTFIKAIVSSLYKYNGIACWKCYLNFEVAILILLGIVAVFFFIITLTKFMLRKKHVVADASPVGQTNLQQTEADNNQKNEVLVTVTIGIMLIVFLVVMGMYILTQAVYLYKTICAVPSEIIICIFYLHCLINPAILMCRDKEARVAFRRLVTCKFGGGNVQQNNQAFSEAKPFQETNMHMTNGDQLSYHQTDLQTVQPEQRFLPTLPRSTSAKQTMSEVRNGPFAPPHEDPDKHISHIDTPPARFAEQNIGFIENGEMVGGHM